MALSAFDERSQRPGADDLKRTLGKSAPLWDRLIAQTIEAAGSLTQDWNFAGAKYGWSLRLKRRDRVVLYMTPQAGEFQLGIVLGAKAVARHAVPAGVRALIEAAPRYAEGIGIRLPIRGKAGLATARHLTAIKLSK